MKRTAVALLLTLAATTANAADIATLAHDYVETRIPLWSAMPVLVAAVQASNSAHANLDEAAILALDAAWRAEIGQALQPTIKPILTNDAASALRAIVQQAGGTIAEIIVMDNRGLNVAAAEATSDFWQGDEAKFTATYPLGAGALHQGEVDFDESSQLFTIQISFTLADASGTPIGAMMVAINAETLD
ncbi:MAG: hypothetical protein Q8Q63_06060 [Phaeovulum sp.]|uniref:hypothetical protein n=1 Tax=Phaeovulum sp. TaxID=2934796 RepID=UPI002731915A|nr:hypothetical protein [Phaeovulum sp.]MDP2062747.1 hypothetical protein [Phaeovulum sp.]MDP3861134.1 hypothetical protein [Phaeovulum sp.]